MLQNRVTPSGSIIQTKARGAWTGTRGLIHNDQQQIIRAFKHQAWIICKLEFKGRKRKVMSPGLYTELFFLDEATAFAAGHRPCCECRRSEFNLFKTYWLKGNPEYGFTEKTSIKLIDAILHRERIDKDFNKVTSLSTLNDLPTGTFILLDDNPYLLSDQMLYPWTAFGYGNKLPLPDMKLVEVLTPKSIINTLRAGYLVHTLKSIRP